MSNLSDSPFKELNDYKDENYICQPIQLKSPLVHIGVGAAGSLNLFEYVQDKKFIYFPNQTALAEALQNPESLQKSKAWQRPKRRQDSRSDFLEQYEKLSEQYINVIERNPRNKDEEIKKIVDKLTRLYSEALGEEWLENKTIFPQTHISANWVNHLLTSDIAPMIRNGFGEIYIPGSSIKGAIRTAIAYYLLKHKTTPQLSQIEHKLRNSMTAYQIKSKKDKLDDQTLIFPKSSLNSYLFSNFKFEYKGRYFGEINTANTDLMRAIKVSDSAPIKIDLKQKINLPVVAEVITSSFHEGGSSRTVKKHNFSSYVEMICNLQTQLYIFVDKVMLKDWFKHQGGMQLPSQLETIQGILEICNEFAQAQWEHEQRYWNTITDTSNLNFSSVRQFYANPFSYNLRLGWGTGMTGTTVDLLFEEATRAKIRDACETRRPTNSTESPKSRRTATIPNQGNSIQQPLGWVNLEPL
ncbi:MAG: type III-A CRISPR-associated RAMP protein Csm5 [Cyanobacteriota bacterium]